MATVLIPIPATDFDPTEAGVPWQQLRAAGHQVVFATPDGRPGRADERVLTGRGFGPLAPLLRADANGRRAYTAMIDSPEFATPRAWSDVAPDDFDAMMLPGGHAPGMRPYLASSLVQALVADAFARDKPVGAICHGVLVAARAHGRDGRSVLHGRRTTALTRQMELSAWTMTCTWLGDYYRTYPRTVQDEVTTALAAPTDFSTGPLALRRDRPDDLAPGFTVRHDNYISARWPGDAHRFAAQLVAML